MLALVTCSEAAGVDTDLPLLQAELPQAAIVTWDDPSIKWSDFGAVVLRSTWDYHRRLEQFRAWATHVTAVSHLWNPLNLIEWNFDKRYLAELDSWGVPIVPTLYLADETAAAQLAARSGFAGDLIVKPSVGASASGVFATHGDESAAQEHAVALLNAGLTPMVQPYLSAVATDGETGLVYLRGEFSHAYRRCEAARRRIRPRRPAADRARSGRPRGRSDRAVSVPAPRCGRPGASRCGVP